MKAALHSNALTLMKLRSKLLVPDTQRLCKRFENIYLEAVGDKSPKTTSLSLGDSNVMKGMEVSRVLNLRLFFRLWPG